jgi:DNA modification methylase
LERVPARQLKPSPANWRRHSARQIEALESVLADVGWADALIARRLGPDSYELIDGHLRAEISGDELVPVLVIDVTKEEADRLLVSLDPIAAMAGTDPEALRALLAKVDVGSDALLEHLRSTYLRRGLERTGKTAPDSLPEVPDATTRPGDLWILGEHRLLCGDATDPAALRQLMNGDRAQLMATDPPYLVGYTGADRPGTGKNWSELYHEVETEGAEEFFRATFVRSLVCLEKNAALYVWHAHKLAPVIDKVWAELGILNHQQIIWSKPVATHTFAVWPWAHEPCLMGWRKGHKPAHNGVNSHAETSVWEVDFDGAARPVGNEHPTQKPVELFRRPIEKHTVIGDICLEPFSGSGTQLIAAQMTGRRCYAMEISPVFCDLAVRRWEAFTGETAERDTTELAS